MGGKERVESMMDANAMYVNVSVVASAVHICSRISTVTHWGVSFLTA